MRKLALTTGLLALAGMLVAPRLVHPKAVHADQSSQLVSSFQPGQGTPPFQVYDVTGPNKGRELCYI